MTLITPLSGVFYHQWASTCYDKAIYLNIWNLYCHILCTYEHRQKCGKRKWFGV